MLCLQWKDPDRREREENDKIDSGSYDDIKGDIRSGLVLPETEPNNCPSHSGT
jgi:hypothetical protein